MLSKWQGLGNVAEGHEEEDDEAEFGDTAEEEKERNEQEEKSVRMRHKTGLEVITLKNQGSKVSPWRKTSLKALSKETSSVAA